MPWAGREMDYQGPQWGGRDDLGPQGLEEGLEYPGLLYYKKRPGWLPVVLVLYCTYSKGGGTTK